MPNINLKDVDSRSVKASLKNGNEYIDDLYYIKDIPIGTFTALETDITGTIYGMGCILLAESTQEVGYSNFDRPTYWKNGYTTIKLQYAMSATDAGAVRFTVALRGISDGDLGHTELFSELVVHTATDVNLRTITVEDTTTPITSAFDTLSVRITRDPTHGSDTTSADMYVFKVTVQYHPINVQ